MNFKLKITMENKIEIFQGENGQTQIEVKFKGETFWLSLQQIAELYHRDKSVISRHLRNIYNEGELERESTVAKNATVQPEGNRRIHREIEYFNLDLILSVGYRVNSKQGTQFRIWATQRLKDFLVQGYAINEARLSQKQQEIQTLKDGIRILSRAIEQKAQDQNLDWLNHFAKGLELLDDYDHENLDKKGLNKRQAHYPELADYKEVI